MDISRSQSVFEVKGTLLLLLVFFFFTFSVENKEDILKKVSTALVQIKKVNGVQNFFFFFLPIYYFVLHR